GNGNWTNPASQIRKQKFQIGRLELAAMSSPGPSNLKFLFSDLRCRIRPISVFFNPANQALLLRREEECSLTPEFDVILTRGKPVRRRPVFRQGRGIHDPSMRSRGESRSLQNFDVVVCAEQLHRYLDVFGPGMAVRIFEVVADE